MILELCVESVEAAKMAEAAGANRLELCSILELGGLTPSVALQKQVRESVQLPVHVLIRPRRGDFCYNADEYAQMLCEISIAKEAGADGVVIGILQPNGEVDINRTKALIELARPLSVTFHRAIDFSRDILEAMEAVIHCGADRILSSGGAATALDGAQTLQKMIQQAAGRIEIMPGAGITSANAKTLVQLTGARELHFSASKTIKSLMQYQNKTLRISNADEYSLRMVNTDEICAIRSLFL